MSAPSGGGPSLSSVSCPAVTVFTAVGASSGFYDDGITIATLAERWSGASPWFTQPTPQQPRTSNPVLRSVSCPSTGVCVAVGSSGDQPLIERWQ